MFCVVVPQVTVFVQQSTDLVCEAISEVQDARQDQDSGQVVSIDFS